ncbi:hypothetical protein PM082_024609 [Marasmius tenuissimus]|nr:hypothetical protein PM082_024609 [Marasmius tenuissimus]
MEQIHEFQVNIFHGPVPTVASDLPILNLTKLLVTAEQASGGGGSAGSDSADKSEPASCALPGVQRSALSTSDIIKAQVATLPNAEANPGSAQAGQPSNTSNSIGDRIFVLSTNPTKMPLDSAERLVIAGTIAPNAVDHIGKAALALHKLLDLRDGHKSPHPMAIAFSHFPCFCYPQRDPRSSPFTDGIQVEDGELFDQGPKSRFGQPCAFRDLAESSLRN